MSNDLISGDFATKIRERVKDAVLGAIPDDKIDALVTQAIDDYFKPRPPLNSYGAALPSYFETLIKEAIESRLKDKLLNEVKYKLDQITYSQEKLDEYVTAMAPVMMNAFFNNWIKGALSEMVRSMPYPQNY